MGLIRGHGTALAPKGEVLLSSSRQITAVHQIIGYVERNKRRIWDECLLLSY